MDQNLFKFDLIAEDPTTHARAGVLHTPHGDIETPIFMPVGTKQTSRAFLPRLSRSSAPRSCSPIPIICPCVPARIPSPSWAACTSS